jgi:hypothetical protein
VGEIAADTAGPGPGIIIGCTVITGVLLPAREAADRFFSSVMMKAQSFMNPNASPFMHAQYSTSYTSYISIRSMADQ